MGDLIFVVQGTPVPQPRSRVTEAARDAGLVRVDQRVAVEITAVFGRPRSHYRRSGVQPTAPLLPRPDCDNLAKAVLDALQDVIGDDTKVSRLVVEKRWGHEGSTAVTVAAGQEDGGEKR